MPNYHHNLQALDTYLHDTGCLYLSDMLDEMLYILMCYSNDERTVCAHDPADCYYQLRQLRDMFKALEPES
jgi:hypothetical protein